MCLSHWRCGRNIVKDFGHRSARLARTQILSRTARRPLPGRDGHGDGERHTLWLGVRREWLHTARPAGTRASRWCANTWPNASRSFGCLSVLGMAQTKHRSSAAFAVPSRLSCRIWARRCRPRRPFVTCASCCAQAASAHGALGHKLLRRRQTDQYAHAQRRGRARSPTSTRNRSLLSCT